MKYCTLDDLPLVHPGKWPLLDHRHKKALYNSRVHLLATSAVCCRRRTARLVADGYSTHLDNAYISTGNPQAKAGQAVGWSRRLTTNIALTTPK